MVIDSMMLPQRMTTPFMQEVRRVTDLPIRFLVNTHHHYDHLFGNETIGAQSIISHPACREEVMRSGRAALDDYRKRLPQWEDDWSQIRIVPPDTTFTDRLTVYAGGIAVELVHFGTMAHTSNDIVVHVPEHGVLFAGDLAFFYVTPVAWDGHVGGWIRVMDRIGDMNVETVVPGHGPVGGRQHMAEMREFLAIMRREARRCYRQGMSAEEAAAAVRVSEYAHWTESRFVARNVPRLYAEFNGEI
jgi:cyclase